MCEDIDMGGLGEWSRTSFLHHFWSFKKKQQQNSAHCEQDILPTGDNAKQQLSFPS